MRSTRTTAAGRCCVLWERPIPAHETGIRRVGAPLSAGGDEDRVDDVDSGVGGLDVGYLVPSGLETLPEDRTY
ncbi:MAG TPA: hypothetical protein VHM29_04195 [Acidimicrobiia bacterium]|nr:hypothetical protein [Acidimicrobiia bacterium]